MFYKWDPQLRQWKHTGIDIETGKKLTGELLVNDDGDYFIFNFSETGEMSEPRQVDILTFKFDPYAIKSQSKRPYWTVVPA